MLVAGKGEQIFSRRSVRGAERIWMTRPILCYLENFAFVAITGEWTACLSPRLCVLLNTSALLAYYGSSEGKALPSRSGVRLDAAPHLATSRGLSTSCSLSVVQLTQENASHPSPRQQLLPTHYCLRAILGRKSGWSDKSKSRSYISWNLYMHIFITRFILECTVCGAH